MKTQKNSDRSPMCIRRKYLWILLLLFCLFLPLIFLPTVLSTSFGKKHLIRYLETKWDVELTIETIHLSWLQKQRVEQCTCKKEGEFLFSFSQFETDRSLCGLLIDHLNWGNTKVTQPQLTLFSLPERRKEPTTTKGSSFQGSIHIHRGFLSFVQREEPSTLFNLENGMVAKERGNFRVHIEGSQQLEIAEDTLSKKRRFFCTLANKEGSWEGQGECHSLSLLPLQKWLSPHLPIFARHLFSLIGTNVSCRFSLPPFSQKETKRDLTYSFSSSQIKTEGNWTWSPHSSTVTGRTSLEATFLPSFVNFLAKSYQLPLEAMMPITLSGNVKQAELTYPFKDLFSLSDCLGNLSIDKTTFLLANRKIELQEGNVEIDKGESFGQTKWTLETVLETIPSLPMRISAWAQTKKNFSSPSFSLFSPFSEGALSFKNIDLAFVDSLSLSPFSFTPYLGQMVEGNVTWKPENHFLFSVKTPQLEIPTTFFSYAKQMWTLDRPTFFSYQLPNRLVNQTSAPISFVIDTFILPAKERILDWNLATLSLRGEAPSLFLSPIPYIGPLSIKDGILEFHSSHELSLQKGKRDLTLSCQMTAFQNLLQERVELTGKMDSISTQESPEISWEIKSPFLKGNVFTRLDKEALSLHRSSHFHFSLDPKWINPLLSSHQLELSLQSPSSCDVSLLNGTLPFSSPHSFSLKGTSSCKLLSLQEKTTRPTSFQFRDLLGKFSFDKDSYEGKVDGMLKEEKESTGTLSFSWKKEKWNLFLSTFSTRLIDALMEARQTLPTLLGPSIDLSLSCSSRKREKAFAFDSKGKEWASKGEVQTKESTLHINKPLTVSWTMNHERLRALQTFLRKKPFSPSFSLETFPLLSLRVNHLSTPLPWNFSQMTVSAKFAIEKWLAKQGKKTKANIDELSLSIEKLEKGPSLSASLSGNLTDVERGRGKVDGKIAFDSQSKIASLSLEDISIFGIETLTHLFLPNPPPLHLFLGDTLSAKIDLDLGEDNQGTLTTALEGQACKILCNAAIKEDTLVLEKPLTGSFTLTDGCRKALREDQNIDLLPLSQPIHLWISPNEFSIPLQTFEIDKIHIGYGSLNLHQITCQALGKLTHLSEFLQLDPIKDRITIPKIAFWFDKVEFSIQQGRMSMRRTEILVNRAYQLATWGEINFVKQFVRMTLGLTSQTLQSLFGIPNLDPKYVLTIPIEGPFGNVTFDTSAASKKIGLLVARKQLATKGGRWGALFGAFGDLMDDQSDVPPPNPPFPWQQ